MCIKKYCLIILFIGIQYINAQDFKEPVFGKLTKNEIDLEYCPFDSAANAVVLFDIGKSEFFETHDGFHIRFKRHKRIKIIKESGFESGAITIPYYVENSYKTDKIKSIQAYTYIVENGKVQKKIKLDPSTVYTEQINEWWKQKKFIFPNLKEGAIIEYYYVHETPFIFNLPDWEFQNRIPIMYSQYQVGLIPFYEYMRLSQRIDTLDYYDTREGEQIRSFAGITFKDYIYTFAKRNIEAFTDEAYITSINDYIMKLDFQLSKVNNPDGSSRNIITTWPELNKSLLANEHFGRYIKNCKRFAKKVLHEQIDTTNLNEEEQIRTIIDYVKKSFYWNGFSGKYASQTAKEFYSKKTGNVADINLFLLALLQEAGFDSKPVILSTRDHGKINFSYPFSRAFNYVLVKVGDENIFLTDATDPLLNYNMIPRRCINDYGLIVNKSKAVKWLQIEYNSPSVNRKKIEINILPERGLCELAIEGRTNFFESYLLRSECKNDTSIIKRKYSKLFDEVYGIETKNYNEPELPYVVSFKAKKELSQLNDYIMFEPFLGITPTENKLKQETRDYPVDILFPKKYRFDISINLPAGYNTLELPQNRVFEDDLISISISYGQDNKNNRLIVLGEYTYKKAVYASESYNLLKSHIDMIVEEFNPEIILKKE